MTNLEKFFRGDLPRRIHADVEEKIESDHLRLHAAGAGAAPRGIRPRTRSAHLGPPGPRPRPTVFAALGPSRLSLLKKVSEAGTRQRPELLARERMQLYSIIYATYRPGPAYLSGHALPEGSLMEKVSPGGPAWRQVIGPHLTTLANAARQCCRLDRQSGTQAGSGFLLENGAILTNRHVIYSRGWLFGQPPDAARHPAVVHFHRLNAMPPPPGDGLTSRSYQLLDGTEFDAALIHLAVDGSRTPPVEAPDPAPLTLAKTPPPVLAGLRVAVIGHPGSYPADGSGNQIPDVFADGNSGDKRLMPGTIDEDAPLVFENNQWFINHNCSTLGGASGSCLVDAATGVVLGLHRAGNETLGNRAIPLWLLKGGTGGELPWIQSRTA